MKISFLLQSNRNPARIYVRLRDSIAVDAKARTKFSIDPREWSMVTQSAIPSSPQFEFIKNALEEIRSRVIVAYNQRGDNDAITSDWLYYRVNGYRGHIPTIGLGLDDVPLTILRSERLIRKRLGITGLYGLEKVSTETIHKEIKNRSSRSYRSRVKAKELMVNSRATEKELSDTYEQLYKINTLCRNLSKTLKK